MRHHPKAINHINNKIKSYERKIEKLPGIISHDSRTCLIMQLIDSIRRVEFVLRIPQSNRPFSDGVLHPHKAAFDPLKAAVSLKRNGNNDEAFWIIFLATHFGKNKNSEWGLLRAVYGNVGQNPIWSWQKVCADPNAFIQWIDSNTAILKTHGSFGNHRKYESLKPSITGAAIKSYIDWINSFGNHAQMIEEIKKMQKNNPQNMFSYLYDSMGNVKRFGRLGKFDFLTMIGKTGLAPIVPNSAYMKEATGPLNGAQLLFYDAIKKKPNVEELDKKLSVLGEFLGQSFCMQILEDALCNWQKSPDKYQYFKG